MNHATSPIKPSWNPWPWSIIGFFVVFVSCVFSFVVFATHQPMDLVRKDYYEEELKYQKQIDSYERTQSLVEKVSVRYEPKPEQLIIALPEAAVRKPSQGKVHLYRPSDAQLDRHLDLSMESSASARQTLKVQGLKPGLWKLRLDWMSDGQSYSHEQTLVIPPKAS